MHFFKYLLTYVVKRAIIYTLINVYQTGHRPGKKMKLTKATVKRLNASRTDTIRVIANILNRSAVILGETGRYEANDGTDELVLPMISSDGKREFVSGRTSGEYEKRIVAGLSTRFPNMISGTFTHGLNGVDIYDVDALVRKISNPT